MIGVKSKYHYCIAIREIIKQCANKSKFVLNNNICNHLILCKEITDIKMNHTLFITTLANIQMCEKKRIMLISFISVK